MTTQARGGGAGGAVRLHLENLLVFGYHGVEEREKTKGSRFLVDVTLEGDFGQAASSDRMEDTADYRDIEREVRRTSRREDHLLIESFARAIAARLLERFPQARKASVRVEKLSPAGLGRGARPAVLAVEERG